MPELFIDILCDIFTATFLKQILFVVFLALTCTVAMELQLSGVEWKLVSTEPWGAATKALS